VKAIDDRIHTLHSNYGEIDAFREEEEKKKFYFA